MALAIPYDIHRIQNVHLAVNRQSFDNVVDLAGFQFRPTHLPYLWEFQHTGLHQKGRLVHVAGFLGGNAIAMQPKAQIYLVDRNSKAEGLIFPSPAKRMRINLEAHRTLSLDGYKGLPKEWPLEMVEKIIRVRMREIVLLKENFLLELNRQKQPAA